MMSPKDAIKELEKGTLTNLTSKAIRTAILALEKQDPKVVQKGVVKVGDTVHHYIFACPICHTEFEGSWRYCPVCGQKLKWEE